jgi:hypothetical protein
MVFFKPKIPIWVNFGVPCNERPFGLFYFHFVNLRPFGVFSPFWYAVPLKIWQPFSKVIDAKELYVLERAQFDNADIVVLPKAEI